MVELKYTGPGFGVAFELVFELGPWLASCK